MSNRERIKKEDRSQLGKFLLILLGCFLVGVVAGVIAGRLKLSGFSFADTWQKAEHMLVYILPCLFVALNIVAGILSTCQLNKAGKDFAAWDSEDEEVADDIDKNINKALALSSVLAVVNLFLFCAEMHFVNKNEETGIISIPTIVMLVFLCVSSILVIAIQKKAVNLSKEMNPEKRGSVYDMHFVKKWEDSSDEGELLINYKAGYKAFKTINVVCIVLFMVCFMIDLPMGNGLLPMLVITVIWLAATISYLHEVFKLEKRN